MYDLTQEEAKHIVSMIKNHAIRGNSEEIGRILENLVAWDRSQQGERDEEEKDYQFKRLRKKLLDELGMIVRSPMINRIK